MKALLIALIVLGILLGIIVAGAIVYALIVFRHEHRWEKIKSEKYEQHNRE